MNLHCESLRTTSTYSHQNAHLFAHTCTYCSFEQYTLYMDVRSKARENAYKELLILLIQVICVCVRAFLSAQWDAGVRVLILAAGQ